VDRIQIAEFLTTAGASHQIEEIINDAEQFLWLISPYLKINKRVKELLEDKDHFKIDIRVIYGKSELQPEENNWLESLASIRTSFRKDLHAKCYLNEDKVLVSSMNLYEFSQQNNDEMGLLVLREEEPALYEEIYDEAMRIVRMSDELRVTVARIEPIEEGVGSSKSRGSRTKGQAPDTGFCIRCGETIGANAARPYCGRCYKSWDRYKNDEYEEKHCHTCGKEHKATMAKPVCPTCYRKHKNWVDSKVK
jgi:phosphatidylserine/phosphatidylglycerophosphate/cardiolipin synthase-like enzyme